MEDSIESKSYLEQYLAPGRFVDSENEKISLLAQTIINTKATDQENAIALYYWVRDSILYNPYTASMAPEAYLASVTAEAGEGWCVPKAILLTALCRAIGVPARLGYADVRNHLSTERLREAMGSDVFYFHGYSSLYLNGRWVKATPAFNLTLCEKFGLKPLEFDGVNDSLYHEFDNSGQRHMEYLHDRGEYLELPFEELVAVFTKHYPNSPMIKTDADVTSDSRLDSSQWSGDVSNETQTNNN